MDSKASQKILPASKNIRLAPLAKNFSTCYSHGPQQRFSSTTNSKLLPIFWIRCANRQ